MEFAFLINENEDAMMQEWEQYDIRTLLDMYMHEAKEFSQALSKGASWQELKDRRQRIKKLNESINAKYAQLYPDKRRRDDRPPHGD